METLKRLFSVDNLIMTVVTDMFVLGVVATYCFVQVQILGNDVTFGGRAEMSQHGKH